MYEVFARGVLPFRSPLTETGANGIEVSGSENSGPGASLESVVTGSRSIDPNTQLQADFKICSFAPDDS